ncbi:hypothetical protein D9M68_303630 [compost metagenome]
MASFAELVDEMDGMIMDSLGDGEASYCGANGAPPVTCIRVMVDRNLEINGPEGLQRTDAVGITWRRESLAGAERGGLFRYGAERFVVEDIIFDDGYIVTAACMEAP